MWVGNRRPVLLYGGGDGLMSWEVGSVGEMLITSSGMDVWMQGLRPALTTEEKEGTTENMAIAHE